MRYVYLGDKWTAPALRGQPCDPVRRADGKCILSVRMATALVRFADGALHVVKRRRLRVTRLLLILLALALSAPAGAATLEWTMPQTNSAGDTLTGYLRWECAASWQTPMVRDSGLAWVRDIRNFATWRPGAQLVILASGYAIAGTHVDIDAPPVISLYGQHSYWVRACRDTCGAWSNPVTVAAP